MSAADTLGAETRADGRRGDIGRSRTQSGSRQSSHQSTRQPDGYQTDDRQSIRQPDGFQTGGHQTLPQSLHQPMAAVMSPEPFSPFTNPSRMNTRETSTPPNFPEKHRHGWRTGARARLINKIEERATQSRQRESKSIGRWDPSKMDHELWMRHGTCLVYLHAQDEDRRPSFRLPLAALLAADCHPVLDLFSTKGVRNPLDWDVWMIANPEFRVQLFIPAPPDATAAEAYRHHLTTRNFFAWALKGNLVFESLGGALVDLLGRMVNWRNCAVDNFADLVAFLAERGLWGFCGQPANALAALHLAETYRIRHVYIDAFAHCIGMGGQLMQSAEYRNLSPTTRRLLRTAKLDADFMLGHTTAQMATFLAADLSETHLGLSAGARSHLERFQDFLVAFYSSRLGSFPPNSAHESSTTVWAPDVYRMLRDDFEALYDFLVDEAFTSAENTPFLAQGGICAVQSVHSFDVRHQFQSLRHPLPLLPEIAPGMLPSGSLWPMLSPNSQASGTAAAPPSPSSPTSPSRRFSRSLSLSLSSFGLNVGSGPAPTGRPDKLRPDERLVTHAALIKATNHHHVHLLDNPLVQAYRQFEEEGTCGPMPSPYRFGSRAADRERERVSLVDSRKVRWILVYAMYQMVRSITDAAPEVRDADDAPYLLFTSMTTDLPLWSDEEEFHDHPEEVVLKPHDSPIIELKPDIDYMEMYQQQEQLKTPRGQSLRIDTQLATDTTPQLSPKSPGLAISLSRKSTLRRSLSMFSASNSAARSRKIRRMASTDKLPAMPTLSVVKKRTSKHNEIVVQGYGNGMTSAIVNAEAEDDPYRLSAPPGLAPAAPVLPMAAILRESTAAVAAASAQRSMSTSSHGSNGSKNSSVASYSTAPTTTPATPTSELGIAHHHHHHHPHSILIDKARIKHHSAPCSQAEDVSGRPAPRRASSLATTANVQSRGRSIRSSTHSTPGRSTPSSRAPSVERITRRSSTVVLCPASAHEALRLASSASSASKRRYPSHQSHPHQSHSHPHTSHLHPQGDEGTTTTSTSGSMVRTRPRSWRDSVVDGDLGAAWTIVSPSLGEGNTCPLELDTRGAMGFSVRVGLV